MADQRRTSRHEAGRGERWVSLLGGPLAAGAQLALSVPLLPLSCAVEWRTIFHLVSLVAALAALGAGMLAWQRLQELRTAQQGDQAHQHLMSYGALTANALALAVIGARWLTALPLVACVRTL